MIKSSKHTLTYTNKAKKKKVNIFLAEYQRVLQLVINYMWTNQVQELNIPKNKLHCPKFLDTETLKLFDTWLTARMKQCIGKQACAMISAAVTKRRKQLYKLKKLQRKGKSTKYLQIVINKHPLVKPDATKVQAEIDGRFIDTQAANHFDEFIRVKTIGNQLTFNIPIKHHEISNYWDEEANRTTGIRLSNNYLCLIFKKENEEIEGTKTVGADQGQNTVLSLSDKQVTTKNKHNHDLNSIQDILARRKKGSNGFKRAQEHRKNYVNWSINQLNFRDIKKVNIEKVRKLRKGKRSSRKNSHWTYTLIYDKLTRLSETEGFCLKEVPNEFRSQRCSQCGWVRKANRKGKEFTCNRCGFAEDADLNAAYNLELDLYEVPFWVRQQKINRSGFYWLEDGLYDVGHECIVRGTEKTEV